MAQNDQEGNGGHKRIADDGSVDAKLKSLIIQEFKRVNDAAHELYFEAPLDPDKQVDQERRDEYWAMAVERFLRIIEPPLRNGEIDIAEQYYRNIELGTVTFRPRYGTDIDFSEVIDGHVPETQFRLQHDIPEHTSLPEPRQTSIVGLKSMIECDKVLTEEWVIDTGMWAKPGQGGVIRAYDAKPIPRRISRDAVRHAYAFLQEAGIGLDIEDEGTPMIRNFDMSGDEPQAEFSRGEYTGDPDL